MTRRVHFLGKELGEDMKHTVMNLQASFLSVPFTGENGLSIKIYDTRFQDREGNYIALEENDFDHRAVNPE